jgi:hypothetical protein
MTDIIQKEDIGRKALPSRRHWKEGFAIKKTLEGRLCHQEDIGRLCRGTVPTERERSAEKQKDLPKYEGWFSKETPSL